MVMQVFSSHLNLSLPLTGRPWLKSISLCCAAPPSMYSLSSILACFSSMLELEVTGPPGASTTNSLRRLDAKGMSPYGGPDLPSIVLLPIGIVSQIFISCKGDFMSVPKLKN